MLPPCHFLLYSSNTIVTLTEETNVNVCVYLHTKTFMSYKPQKILQWGSEYRTSLVFEWFKAVRSLNGSLLRPPSE